MKKKWLLLPLLLLMSMISCQKVSDPRQTLRVNISREPTSFDPRKVFDPSHQMLMSMLFEGLVKLELDLSVSTAQAESYEISVDGKTLTFYLGEHHWSDGSPVTAQDFVGTYLDLLDPNFPAPHAHMLYDVENGQEAKQGLISLDKVGIAALDSKTIQFQLKQPNPCFLQILASPHLVPISRKAEEKNRDWPLQAGSDYICNGPFTFLSWVPQAEIVFEKNREYRGHYPAKLKRVEISLIANEMSALHMYANGYLDIVGTPFSQIPLPYLKDLKASGSLYVQPVSASLFVAFNTRKAPFDNVYFRKALALAIDRKEIIEHVTLLDEEPAIGPIPSVLKGALSGSLGLQDADVEGAKNMLSLAMETLLPDEIQNLTLYFWPMEINYLIAQTLQQQWEKNLGLHVQIEVIDFKTLLGKVTEESYPMSIFAWSAHYADPSALLNRFSHRKDAMNYPRWESARFCEELERYRQKRNPEERKQILEEIEKILLDEMPIAPLFHWSFSLLIQPKIRGFAMDPLGNVRFDRISKG